METNNKTQEVENTFVTLAAGMQHFAGDIDGFPRRYRHL